MLLVDFCDVSQLPKVTITTNSKTDIEFFII